MRYSFDAGTAACALTGAAMHSWARINGAAQSCAINARRIGCITLLLYGPDRRRIAQAVAAPRYIYASPRRRMASGLIRAEFFHPQKSSADASR
jgi:hypothetical protein